MPVATKLLQVIVIWLIKLVSNEIWKIRSKLSHKNEEGEKKKEEEEEGSKEK